MASDAGAQPWVGCDSISTRERQLRAKGPAHPSLGQRPRNRSTQRQRAESPAPNRAQTQAPMGRAFSPLRVPTSDPGPSLAPRLGPGWDGAGPLALVPNFSNYPLAESGAPVIFAFRAHLNFPGKPRVALVPRLPWALMSRPVGAGPGEPPYFKAIPMDSENPRICRSENPWVF